MDLVAYPSATLPRLGAATTVVSPLPSVLPVVAASTQAPVPGILTSPVPALSLSPMVPARDAMVAPPHLPWVATAPLPATRQQNTSNPQSVGQPPISRAKQVGYIAKAVGLFLMGRLLHRLPARHLKLSPNIKRGKWVADVIPTDWKDWARMGLGVGVVNKVNDAINRPVPPWLVALETVAVLTPMMSPKMLGKQAWKSFPLIAIGVPLLVQATQWAKTTLNKEKAAGRLNVPNWVPNVALPAVSMVVGIIGLRSAFKATGQVAGAEMAAICPRCGGMHLACPTEIAEFFGGLAGGMQHPTPQKPKPTPLPLNPYLA